MIKNRLYKLSLLLNVILLITVMAVAIRKKEKILDIFQPRRFNVIMIGHSLTGGCNWNKELNRSDIKNDGMGGGSTFNFLQQLFDDVLIRRPKICFIDGGLNDVEYGIPLKNIYANYTILVDTLLKHNIKPVLQSTIYCFTSSDSITNAYGDSVNLFLIDLAAKRHIPYVNINQYLSKNGRLNPIYTIDGYHLNSVANKIWAREVKKVLDAEKI